MRVRQNLKHHCPFCSNISVYNNETHKVRYIRRSIGHLDPATDEVVSNRRKGDIGRQKMETQNMPVAVLLKTSVYSFLDKAVFDIPGSIKDVNTLEDSMANISFGESPAYHFVIDKGFYICGIIYQKTLEPFSPDAAIINMFYLQFFVIFYPVGK